MLTLTQPSSFHITLALTKKASSPLVENSNPYQMPCYRKLSTHHRSSKNIDSSSIFQNPLLRETLGKMHKRSLHVNWCTILDHVSEYVRNGGLIDIPICESIVVNPKLNTVKHWICTNKQLKLIYLPCKSNSSVCDILHSITMRKPIANFKKKEKIAFGYDSSENCEILAWESLFSLSKNLSAIQFIKNSIQTYENAIYYDVYTNGGHAFFYKGMGSSNQEECNNAMINNMMAHLSIHVIELLEYLLYIKIYSIKIAYLLEQCNVKLYLLCADHIVVCESSSPKLSPKHCEYKIESRTALKTYTKCAGRNNPLRSPYGKLSKLNLTTVPIGFNAYNQATGFLLTSKIKEVSQSPPYKKRRSLLITQPNRCYNRRPISKQYEKPSLYECVANTFGL